VSSILDALKKAERESIADREGKPPWPPVLSAQSRSRHRSRRWWLPLGVIVGCGAVAAVFWMVRQPQAPLPASPETTASALRTIQESPVAVVSEAPPPRGSNAENEPGPSANQALEAEVVLPLLPENTALPVSEETEAVAAPPGAQKRQGPVGALHRSSAPAPSGKKKFRSDPRIALQALVWAPEAAGRFVVINNRLIKEGGTLDNIVVLEINRDEVLLSEGAERWYQPFKVR
jgi:hypothetical protein